MNSTSAEQNYWTAAAQSFKWQVKTREVPVSDQVVTEIPLGFQPLGISARGDMVLITDYFAPAVCMNRVTVDDNTLRFEVSWIHGAQNGITRCRGGFPDMAYPTGANRCVTAFFAPDGKSVCVGRIDREFFLLTPQENAQWRITGQISLPENPDYPFVHSATIYDEKFLVTVESNAKMDLWRTAGYGWWGNGDDTGKDWVARAPEFVATIGSGGKIPRFYYGVDQWRYGQVLVASSHSVRGADATSPGIYVDGKLTVPRVIGSGICILPNEGALVAQYGQEEEDAHKGNPGKLIYVPPALLK